jgi:hypothetical protein
MPNVPDTSAGFSQLSQSFERMKLAELSVGLSIWGSIECWVIDNG